MIRTLRNFRRQVCPKAHHGEEQRLSLNVYCESQSSRHNASPSQRQARLRTDLLRSYGDVQQKDTRSCLPQFFEVLTTRRLMFVAKRIFRYKWHFPLLHLFDG